MQSLLSVESPFPEAHSMLRFLEPPGSCVQTLWTRIFDGTYDKPFIVDTHLRRFLHFDFDNVQSAMDLSDPDRLTLAYTRKMMAFLLFNRAPGRILLLGLGGGSLAKFCHRRLPTAVVTAVELNSDVIALREVFAIPENSDRFQVICADGAAYVAQLAPVKDVILVDACDRTGVATELDIPEFYENARRCLTPGGVFVINVCGDRQRRAAHLLKIRDVFGEAFLTMQARLDGNLIVLAFKDHSPQISPEVLQVAAVDLKRRFALDFPRYVRRMAIDLQLRRWERALDSDAAEEAPDSTLTVRRRARHR
jgi:spermidine synthase